MRIGERAGQKNRENTKLQNHEKGKDQNTYRSLSAFPDFVFS